MIKHNMALGVIRNSAGEEVLLIDTYRKGIKPRHALKRALVKVLPIGLQTQVIQLGITAMANEALEVFRVQPL